MNKWQYYSESHHDTRNLAVRLDGEFHEPPALIAGLRKACMPAHSLSETVKELAALAMAVASGITSPL